VSFAAITLCVASQPCLLFFIVSLSTQSGNFWIHPRKLDSSGSGYGLVAVSCYQGTEISGSRKGRKFSE
jgi:hypothetical protein